MPLTVELLEARLINTIAPGNPSRFCELLTEADERLLNSGKWSWTRGVLTLAPTPDGEILLPDGYESICGCRIGSIAKGVLWQDIEYLEDGPGLIPVEGCSAQLIDQGLLARDGYATVVRVYKVCGLVDEVTVLARYEALDLGGMDGADPVVGTPRRPRCQSLTALKQAMLAIIYEEANDIERSTNYLAMAKDTLDKQEEAYRGSARKIYKPALSMPLRRRSKTSFP